MPYDLVLAARDARRAGGGDARRRRARGLRHAARGRRHADGELERRRQRAAGRAGGSVWARGSALADEACAGGRVARTALLAALLDDLLAAVSADRAAVARAPRPSPPRPAGASDIVYEALACVRPHRAGAVRSGQVRVGQIRSGQSRPGWAGLG